MSDSVQETKGSGQKILQNMVNLKAKTGAVKAGYPCHTESTYSDGYGDSGYGDYSDG